MIIHTLQVTVNGDVETEVEKVTETLGELQFEEEEDENAFYTKVSLQLGLIEWYLVKIFVFNMYKFN